MEYDRPSLNPLFWRNFSLLVCEVFRVHEIRSQLEVTETLECKVNLIQLGMALPVTTKSTLCERL